MMLMGKNHCQTIPDMRANKNMQKLYILRVNVNKLYVFTSVNKDLQGGHSVLWES